MKQFFGKVTYPLFLGLLSGFKPPQYQGNEWPSPVYPHGSIEELAANLWHVTGVLKDAFLPREMVIYRLPDGSLVIHSAIALNETEMARLESLGTPKIMIVPNRIHRLDAGVFKKRYPQLLVTCPAAAKPYVEEVVPVDGIAEEILPEYGIICHKPDGIKEQEFVYELALPNGKALIFTDILFNLTDAYLEKYLPDRRAVLERLGSSGYFGMTKVGQLYFMSDRRAYRQWLETLGDRVTDLRVISVAHGEPITENCSQRLREAAMRLA